MPLKLETPFDGVVEIGFPDDGKTVIINMSDEGTLVAKINRHNIAPLSIGTWDIDGIANISFAANADTISLYNIDGIALFTGVGSKEQKAGLTSQGQSVFNYLGGRTISGDFSVSGAAAASFDTSAGTLGIWASQGLSTISFTGGKDVNSVLASAAQSNTSLIGAFSTGTESSISFSGSSSGSFVGARDATGDVSAAGAGMYIAAGAAEVLSALSSGGVGATALVGGRSLLGSTSILGVSDASFIGMAGKLGLFSVDGLSTVSINGFKQQIGVLSAPGAASTSLIGDSDVVASDIELVSSNSDQPVSSSTNNLGPLPLTDAVQDDFAMIMVYGDDTGSTVSIGGGATDWVQLFNENITGVGRARKVVCFYKVLTDSETAPEIDFSKDEQWSATIHIWRNVDPVNPFNVAYSQADHRGEQQNTFNALSPRSIVTTNPNCAIINYYLCTHDNISAYVEGSGYSAGEKVISLHANQGCQYLANSGAAGTKTPPDWANTGSGSIGESTSYTFALNKAA